MKVLHLKKWSKKDVLNGFKTLVDKNDYEKKDKEKLLAQMVAI